MLIWTGVSSVVAWAQVGNLIVTVTSPTSGSTLTGTTLVQATTSLIGAQTVVGVQFRVDGVDLGAEDTTAPYSIAWNTTTTSNSSHTLTAIARDQLGMRYTSDPVAVAVCNPSATFVRIEDTDGCIAYGNGWTHDTGLRPWSGGSAAMSTGGAQA